MDDRLQRLVKKLDTMGAKPTLIDVAAALEQSDLTYSSIESYVRITPHNYTRATVVLRDQYELLVLTWLGGQSSVPHDHGGSICAMLTMRGQAVEGHYSVAPDGYVDLQYETCFNPGELTADQDAAVHTVRNPRAKEDLLVTVHIYSPPLRDFRRFKARPPLIHQTSAAKESAVPTVAIVGGGFSGSITAAQILRQGHAAGVHVKVVLVEKRGSIGEGLAYGTSEACHLLNVPAGRMSAWPDQPNDFLQWACARDGEITADDFLPRRLYGEYIRETLLRAARIAPDPTALSVVFDDVRRIARHPAGGWMLNSARQAPIRADAVVLAIGHRAPNDPLAKKWSGPSSRYIQDPWKPFAMNPVAPQDSVIIMGSGLTAMDAIMTLVERGHHGRITLVSRRGLLPQAHLAGHGSAVDMTAWVAKLTGNTPLRALTLCRRLRERVAMAANDGHPWQAVIDGLRPHIAGLWSKLPIDERRKFLAQLRPFWEVHRHRLPIPVARRCSSLIDQGLVGVVRGRVESVNAADDQLQVAIRARPQGDVREMTCGWIVNATGPSPANSAAANPAIGSLLIQGLLAPDELNLGIQTTHGGNAIDANGEPVKDLFVVGTLRKPELWESTAVPELRAQAEETARRIVTRCRSETSGTLSD